MGVVIKVENISKQYRLGLVGKSSVKDDIKRLFNKGNDKNSLFETEENDRTTKSSSNYVWSLKDISFELEQGEALGVLGRNGAGKSTLLKVLSRITSPTTGSIKLKGKMASLLEVGTGFHPELTGRENIFLNGAILGMRKSEIKRKLDEIVDFAGVERYLDTPVKRYSSGMYVRLAFAVAAHLDNDIMIIDEVLAVGDAEFQKKCLGKMDSGIKDGGKTVIFVSHNISSIQNLCTKGIVLNNGRLTFNGSSSEAVQFYLEQSLSNNGAVVQFEEKNQDIQLLKIEILNAQMIQQSNFDLGDYVYVRIDYQVKSPLKGTNTCLVLKRNGVDVLCSFDCDEDESNLNKIQVGYHSYLVHLPTDILKAGLYSISLDVGLIGIGVIEQYDEVLSFKIHELSEATGLKGYAESRAGMLYKKIEWKKI